MSIESVTHFIGSVSHDPASSWDYSKLTALAGLSLPPDFFGDQDTLLKADQHRLWLKWFIEGLTSPSRFAGDTSLGRLDIYKAVLDRVTRRYNGADLSRRKALTDTITDHICAEVDRLRAAHKRDYASSATRQFLIAASSTPRCYICGYAFSQEAIDEFLRVRGRNSIVLPALVDIFRPRGLSKRDVSIEIEHVVPVAQGGSGQANLRLSCGWCNKHKSSRVSLYEAPFVAPRTTPFVLGPHRMHEIPAPFWTVRIMALRGRCQHFDGCDRTVENAELFVALTDCSGSPNPTNLSIYCKEHDPMDQHRRVDRAVADQIWSSRR